MLVEKLATQLTDKDIASLLIEPKILPENFHAHVRLRSKRGHKEYECAAVGSDGNSFLLKFRQNEMNIMDFSVILLYQPKESNQYIRLRRYNGKSHEHTNRIEGDTFFGFHIHTATERYQQLGLDEDAFAEPTDRYASFSGATECMLEDCGFVLSTKNKSLVQWGMN